MGINTKQFARWQLIVLAIVAAVTVQITAPFFINRASAGTLTNTMVRFDRMSTSTATTGTVCAKPATVGIEASAIVAFPTGYTVSTTVANWTVSTTNLAWPSGGTAWPGIGTATAAAGQNVTFPSTDLTVGTLYCFNWTNTAALSTSSSATNSNTGTITTQTSVPATIDTGTYATATVTNDQIAVTASVSQSFSMAFSANTDALGNLTTSAVASSPTPRTITISTNAKNGWMAWAKDANTGLNSTSASYTIASTGVGLASQALVAGTEGYNLGVAFSQTSGTCTAGSAVSANFDKAGVSNKGGGLDSALRNILTCGGTSNAGVVTLTNFAAINGGTPAASDYADTETFVAGGIF